MCRGGILRISIKIGARKSSYFYGLVKIAHNLVASATNVATLSLEPRSARFSLRLKYLKNRKPKERLKIIIA